MASKDAKKLIQYWEKENKIVNPNDKKPIIEIIDQIASLFASGSFFYYIIDFVTYEMTFVHDGIMEVLGIKPKDWSVNTFFDLIHPDEIKNVHEKEAVSLKFLFNKIPNGDIMAYKKTYLIKLKHVNGSYKTILHQAKAINISHDGKVQTVIGIDIDVTHLNLPIRNEISFISRKKPNVHFAKIEGVYTQIKSISYLFTIREKEIMALMKKGKTAIEIGNILNISNHTVNTHKRNMLKKAECKNSRELVSKCLQEGIV